MIEKIINDLKVRYTNKHHRLQHVYNVKDTALLFAKKFDVDEEKTIIASLLHDITKYEPINVHKKLIKSYYQNAGSIIENFPNTVWHAFSAAAYAHQQYHIDDDDILNAIMNHTIGRAKMSKLEEILFLADYIEPNRTNEHAKYVRKIAQNNFTKAIFLVMDLSIKYHEAKKSFVPIEAYKARDYYKQLVEEYYEKN